MNDFITWVQLIATLGLLLVTYWYARTTKRMAETAKDAAQSSKLATSAAERSARAARDAATVAQSQIRPEFECRRIGVVNYLDEPEQHTGCLQLRSLGDAVVVQECRIVRAFRRSTLQFGKQQVDLEDAELTPHGIDAKLPIRMHYGEELILTHAGLQDAQTDPLERLILSVRYTFVEHGETGGCRTVIMDES